MENFKNQVLVAKTAKPTIKMTAKAAKSAVTIGYKRIAKLANERIVWQGNEFRTSNDKLYLLLQNCYQIYMDMAVATDEAKALRDALEKYIVENSIGFAAKTHTLNKIVACVFGVDRRRVGTYGGALKIALKEKVAVSDIATYIRDKGGVEEIRLTKAAGGLTTIKKAQAAMESLAKEKLAVAEGPSLSSRLDAGYIGKPTVFIGTWQADGSVIINAVVLSNSVLNSALACYYSNNKNVIVVKRSEMIAANQVLTKDTAIANAAMDLKAA
jgi:hypothetical protein